MYTDNPLNDANEYLTRYDELENTEEMHSCYICRNYFEESQMIEDKEACLMVCKSHWGEYVRVYGHE